MLDKEVMNVIDQMYDSGWNKPSTQPVNKPLSVIKLPTSQQNLIRKIYFFLHILSDLKSTDVPWPVSICRRICVSVVSVVWYRTQILHTFCTSAESTRLPPTGLRMLRTDADFWKALLKRSGDREAHETLAQETQVLFQTISHSQTQNKEDFQQTKSLHRQ